MKSEIIIDKRMRTIEKQRLTKLGFNIIEIKENKNIYGEISSHVDIFTCKIGDKLIIEPSVYELIKEKIQSKCNLEKGQDLVEGKYPQDIRYNVCIIGKKALHNFKYTDPKIKKELKEQGYECINTNQGYTNCSIAVIDDKSAIVTDKGLYKILQKHNIEVLYLEYEPDIKLLVDGKYSAKKGFIGGVISKIGNNIIITGDLEKIDKDEKIRKFIQNRNLNIIEFKGLDVIDYGGILAV